ncbi:MAG: cadmium-translocating P-type ATPase [Caldilineales bacterium]|nr:cadmium-translocating P-type ATPase [Caldilineales bacterium]
MTITKLDLRLLLPEIDVDDACTQILTDRLAVTRGVEEAHITRENDTAHLCLHYDANLVPLAKIQRLAEEVGGQISARYRHETLVVSGLDAADAAVSLAEILSGLDGMLHAQVNYVAGLAFVAYDSEVLQQQEIVQAIRGMRYGVAGFADEESEEHDHGGAPAFLPHWLQERWAYLLVGLAGLFFLIGWLGETFLGMPSQVAVVFFVLSYVAGGYDIATHAIPGLLKGKFDTDVLMLAAAAGAAILGEWAEGAFLLFLFALGHAGEHYALDRARNAVQALGELMPKTARVKQDGRITELPVEQVQIGDVVVARPGDRIPVDGRVQRGESGVDQSPITGESVPVDKGEGDEVFAGSINQDAALDIEVTRLAKDNTLSRVMQLVAEAQSQQSPTQRYTERFTARLVPAILVLDLLVIVLPPLFGWMPLNESFYRGMLLLVAASPCALALGTPAAVLAGIAQAARNGVLIKGGVHLENLGAIKAMAFDKTGTLTEGRFQITDVIALNGASETDLLRMAAAIEQQSSHPLAQAVVRHAQALGLTLPAADGLENISGRGVRSEVEGLPVAIGSLKLFEMDGGGTIPPDVVAIVEGLEGDGKTTMAVSHDDAFLGVLGLADTPRPGVRQTLQRLLDLGVEHLIMLTGDNDDVAKRIAEKVGVTDVRAELLPEQKLDAIKDLQSTFGKVAMIGDGVNDAPALATSTVGIAMGGAGTAVALETADVALMADDLGKLPFAVGLSQASRRIIFQNLIIALGVILLLVTTSVFGLVQLSGAVILHEGSTIIVVMNALRLLRYQTPR